MQPPISFFFTWSPSTAAAALLLVAAVLVRLSAATLDTFIYVGCSQVKFSPGTQYESDVDSLLTSVVNAAGSYSYNHFAAGGGAALFQCRPDLPAGDCARCVARAVSQLGVLCADAAGAVIQLDGCLVKYDNVSFLGVEDKTLVVKKCGPQLAYGNSDELNRRDAVLGYLSGEGESFRVGGSGIVQGVAQCIGDLSAGECRDCLGEAVGRLRSECGTASWGDVFLVKCYARYSVGGAHAYGKSGSSNDDETEKKLAILIGLIAVVALLVFFAAFLRKLCEEKGGK